MNNEQLIISLIKDDLINTKLISGLENLGIDAGLYLLGISDAIFILMGIDDSNKQGEELFEYYLELRYKKLSEIDLCKSHESIEIFALQVFEALISKWNFCKMP